MSLSSKIEEIRRKPEREKIRYVWAMVFICMIFIIFVWIFSLKNSMQNEDVVNSGGEVMDNFESLENSQGTGEIPMGSEQKTVNGFSGESN